MPTLTLKIDVDTYRGTREGVPHLVQLLKQYNANATFLFSLGPDHTGWALRRVFRPGFFKKASRTSVLTHYGLKTLMYGVLLPAPDIGLQCGTELRSVADAGFECGIHTWDHVVWQDQVRHADAAWTNTQLTRAIERFSSIFGKPSPTHGAAGWQMNEHALVKLDQLGMRYSSDSRARLHDDGRLVEPEIGPYRIALGDRVLQCVQIPTTLPTLDELLGRCIHGVTLGPDTLSKHLLSLTAEPRDHVFTLHAELEGQKLAPIFEQLLIGWQAQGYRFNSMAQYYESLAGASLPIRPLSWGHIPGRSGDVMVA